MKTTLAILGFLFAASAHADLAHLECSNGPVEKVGDGMFQVNIVEDGLQVFPYEGQFSLDGEGLKYDGDVLSVVNKTVNMSVEGEEKKSVINAQMILDRAENTLNVAISYGRGPFHTYELKCVNKE